MATSNKTSKPAKPSEAAGKGLKVTARPPSFRRGGFTFTGEARVLPVDELTDEQYEQITGDANLVSQVVDLPKEAAPKK